MFRFIYHLNCISQEFPAFIKQVVDQTEVNLRRIQAFGVKKIAVPSLQPLGCLPGVTVASSFQRCNESQNALVKLHNNLLQQVVAKLNNETKQSTFIVLDLYNAFLTVFKNKGASPGKKNKFLTFRIRKHVFFFLRLIGFVEMQGVRSLRVR